MSERDISDVMFDVVSALDKLTKLLILARGIRDVIADGEDDSDSDKE